MFFLNKKNLLADEMKDLKARASNVSDLLKAFGFSHLVKCFGCRERRYQVINKSGSKRDAQQRATSSTDVH